RTLIRPFCATSRGVLFIEGGVVGSSVRRFLLGLLGCFNVMFEY
ncbi:hypothetical protein KIPB_015804, partial [Kipferlia bialata]